MAQIRVRFAPSPTGFVHVGSLRTALYNYLFARHHKGVMVLRIEDTDQSRLVPGAVENLLDTLNWTGLTYDEGPVVGGDSGPYYQSERRVLYEKMVNELLEKGHAYPCFCSAERLEKMREQRIADNESPSMYDGMCRQIPAGEARRRMAEEAHTVRMKVPAGGETVLYDMIRGAVRFQNTLLDDQILMKSDGFPTYHLANVVDDHLMGITHVIRGEEWLPSTPKHVLLYQAFGWEQPQFAHLPLLLNEDRSKLSKRQGDVAVEDYRNKGILPQALLNFVALLGWSPGEGEEKELFDLDELIDRFSLERVNKSGAVFDISKLEWMNGIYIRSMDENEYVKMAVDWLRNVGQIAENDDAARQIVLSVRERINTLNELNEKTAFFFEDKIRSWSESALEYIRKEQSKALFAMMLREIDQYTEITPDTFRELMKTVQTQSGVKGKDLWMPVRSAMTGTTEGPELPQVIRILGKKKVMAFLQQAINL